MSDARVETADPDRPHLRAAATAVFCVSAAIIAVELLLMRCLAFARWHNFSYLVISTALLGFGAAGTILTLVGRRMLPRYRAWATGLTLAFALSVPASLGLAEALPLNARNLLNSPAEIGWMGLYHLLLFVPFLLGAAVVGLSLMRFEGRSYLVYAANLGGSGAGGLAAVALMAVLAPEHALHVVALAVAVSALLWQAGVSDRWQRAGAVVLVVCILAVQAMAAPLRLQPDQYKGLFTMRQLAEQGDAEHLATRYGPRARIDLYRSPRLHGTMFAALGQETPTPPDQAGLMLDGQLVAPVFVVDSPEDAAILDYTPMSIAYRLVDRPRVLILGEVGGGGVLLAQRMGAEHVTVVQSNPELVELMRERLDRLAGGAFSSPEVSLVAQDPRGFLERSRQRFDVIHVASLEGMAAGSSALMALHENFLLTCEGLGAAVQRLSARGLLTVTRGLQQPARDNVKLLATMDAALRATGRPAEKHVAQLRNYLAVTTLAFAEPPGPERCGRLLRLASEHGMDIEWVPCAGVEYGQQRNVVDGPEGASWSWYHQAALQVFRGDADEFYDSWVYNVRPATDDSPYFFSFFRWKSLPRFLRIYGDQWLMRMELGYAVLVFALVEVVVVGLLLILLPLMWLRRRHQGQGARLSTGVYFTCLGLGYMLLEMVCLFKFTRFLGDPIYSAACVISGFLVFSGAGSAVSMRLFSSPRWATRAAVAVVVAWLAGVIFGLDALFVALDGWPTAGRVVAALVVVAPVAFAMGWPFPAGLALLERNAPPLVPWGWAANGFASVAASPLAALLAVESGFRTVFIAAGACYALALIAVGGLAMSRDAEADHAVDISQPDA